MPGSRYAVSYTPPPYSPLAKFGAGILGYDCFEGVDVPQPGVPGIDPAILSLLTVELRRYGFHAGLAPPFGFDIARESELMEMVESLAKQFYPILVGPLTLVHADQFIVLRAASHQVQLTEFLAACHSAFGLFLNPRVDRGTVSDTFRFEMRLAGPVPAGAPGDLVTHFQRAFEGFARDELELGTISLMCQDEPAARFRVLTCARLTGR